MSPTLVFPPPFRSRDLPPYGPADWRRLQPALLRRSLALSSALSLIAGLAMTLLLHQVAVVAVERGPTVILPPPPPRTDENAYKQPTNVPPAKVDPNSTVIPVTHETTTVLDSVVLPTSIGPFDPTAPVSIGPSSSTTGPGTAETTAPDRPDPNAYVALDEPPREVYAPKPEYPEIARQAQMQGTVVLRVLVSKEGKVQELIMAKSSPVFDDAAESAIRQWQFRPAIMGHQTVAAWVTIPVRFVLNE